MTVFLRVWNTAYEQSPADTDEAKEGALRIRNMKIDVRERVAVDHSLAGDADDGAHKKVTYIEQASDPSTVADRGYSYAKDVSGETEFFYMDSAGNVIQITSGGVVKSALLDSGPEMLDNISYTATVAANALTIALKDKAGADPSTGTIVKVAFRSATLTDPKYTVISLTAALSIVVLQGATLGFLADETDSLYVYLFNKAGTVGIAVSKAQSVVDETQLYSITAVDVNSDSADTLYGDVVATDVALRFIGKIQIKGGATPGDWENAPTEGHTTRPPSGVRRQMFTSSGSFIVPTGVTEILVTTVAGGGGGGSGMGGATGSARSGGGGGGAGETQRARYTVTPGASYTVTIGSGGGGGAGSAGNGNNGSTGEATSLGALQSVVGGAGGLGGLDGNGGDGGLPGGIVGSEGRGEAAGDGDNSNGGGGHVCRPFGAGGGGSAGGGAAAGAVGKGYGGGGGGSGGYTASTTGVGGAGGAGFIEVEW